MVSAAWSSAGNMTRAISELGLTSVEQQRMLRNNNLVTTTFMGEKDARAQEKSDQDLKAADLEFKKISAEASRKAADLAVISAAVAVLGTALKIGADSRKPKGSKDVNWAKNIGDALNGIGNLITKVLDRMKADEEVKAVEEDLRRLNAMRAGTDKAVAALDANPYG